MRDKSVEPRSSSALLFLDPSPSSSKYLEAIDGLYNNSIRELIRIAEQ